TSRNPRSTVATITEIYDYLRLLYARVGHAFCYNCGREITQQSVQQIVDRIRSWPEGTRIHLLAPIVRDRKGEYKKELSDLRRAGFVRAKIDGKLTELGEDINLNKNQRHTIEVMVDRLAIHGGIEKRLSDSLEVAFKYGEDLLKIERLDGIGKGESPEVYFSQRFACVQCGISYPEITPRMFSFNSPHGACSECSGIGSIMYFDPELVVQNEDLSIADGAIAPWATMNYMQPVLESLAAHYEFSLDQAWKTIPAKVRKAILNGSGTEEIEFSYQRGQHRHGYARPFEGVLTWLDRRYKETESEGIREVLEAYMNMRPCPACEGTRLKKESLFVRFNGKPISDVVAMSIKQAHAFFAEPKMSSQETEIARLILKEIRERLSFLAGVGLDYLTLDRSSGSLSGGEGQRIRLATQIGSSLVGVLYILDEPSIGLHQRDNQRLLATLKRLRDIGNSVLVVEHDRDTMLEADHIIDMGPGAGVHGGYLVAQGTPAEVMNNPASITGKYLTGALEIAVPSRRRQCGKRWLTVRGARENNLRDVTVAFPLGVMVCVTGVSGSGKSTLVLDTLNRALAQKLNNSRERSGAYKTIEGVEHLDKVIHVDQSPIGRTPRSNPATYTGLFTHVRELFAQLPEARMRGYGPGRFSFNVKGGRCEACQGDGIIRIEMHFLPDVYVTCEVCAGKRYNRDTLEIQYKGKSIAEVLNMTVLDAIEFMSSVPLIRQKLETLRDVGLDYIHLGQSATTLSGGEAQRIKLAKELARRATGRTLYILDEPTTGLHFDDIKKLLEVLGRLADAGNTVLVIEHNLEVIKTADYVIDLGPEGGDRGGQVIAKGTPEEVAATPGSYTGEFLRQVLDHSAAA
ncbi:MAG TPA: excinuclease ABC subunit UvrA, partial [Candidatus Binataceae bacterium]|nr:excinuclease ABC subunit UvrA [Candidatus Binataceae bacterium]